MSHQPQTFKQQLKAEIVDLNAQINKALNIFPIGYDNIVNDYGRPVHLRPSTDLEKQLNQSPAVSRAITVPQPQPLQVTEELIGASNEVSLANEIEKRNSLTTELAIRRIESKGSTGTTGQRRGVFSELKQTQPQKSIQITKEGSKQPSPREEQPAVNDKKKLMNIVDLIESSGLLDSQKPTPQQSQLHNLIEINKPQYLESAQKEIELQKSILKLQEGIIKQKKTGNMLEVKRSMAAIDGVKTPAATQLGQMTQPSFHQYQTSRLGLDSSNAPAIEKHDSLNPLKGQKVDFDQLPSEEPTERREEIPADQSSTSQYINLKSFINKKASALVKVPDNIVRRSVAGGPKSLHWLQNMSQNSQTPMDSKYSTDHKRKTSQAKKGGQTLNKDFKDLTATEKKSVTMNSYTKAKKMDVRVKVYKKAFKTIDREEHSQYKLINQFQNLTSKHIRMTKQGRKMKRPLVITSENSRDFSKGARAMKQSKSHDDDVVEHNGPSIQGNFKTLIFKSKVDLTRKPSGSLAKIFSDNFVDNQLGYKREMVHPHRLIGTPQHKHKTVVPRLSLENLPGKQRSPDPKQSPALILESVPKVKSARKLQAQTKKPQKLPKLRGVKPVSKPPAGPGPRSPQPKLRSNFVMPGRLEKGRFPGALDDIFTKKYSAPGPGHYHIDIVAQDEEEAPKLKVWRLNQRMKLLQDNIKDVRKQPEPEKVEQALESRGIKLIHKAKKKEKATLDDLKFDEESPEGSPGNEKDKKKETLYFHQEMNSSMKKAALMHPPEEIVVVGGSSKVFKKKLLKPGEDHRHFRGVVCAGGGLIKKPEFVKLIEEQTQKLKETIEMDPKFDPKFDLVRKSAPALATTAFKHPTAQLRIQIPGALAGGPSTYRSSATLHKAMRNMEIKYLDLRPTIPSHQQTNVWDTLEMKQPDSLDLSPVEKQVRPGTSSNLMLHKRPHSMIGAHMRGQSGEVNPFATNAQFADAKRKKGLAISRPAQKSASLSNLPRREDPTQKLHERVSRVREKYNFQQRVVRGNTYDSSNVHQQKQYNLLHFKGRLSQNQQSVQDIYNLYSKKAEPTLIKVDLSLKKKEEETRSKEMFNKDLSEAIDEPGSQRLKPLAEMNQDLNYASNLDGAIPLFPPTVPKIGGTLALGTGQMRPGGNQVGITGLGSLLGFSGAVGITTQAPDGNTGVPLPAGQGIPQGGLFWKDFGVMKQLQTKIKEHAQTMITEQLQNYIKKNATITKQHREDALSRDKITRFNTMLNVPLGEQIQNQKAEQKVQSNLKFMKGFEKKLQRRNKEEEEKEKKKSRISGKLPRPKKKPKKKEELEMEGTKVVFEKG